MEGNPQTRAIQDKPAFVARNPQKRRIYVQGVQLKTHAYVERDLLKRPTQEKYPREPYACGKRPIFVERDLHLWKENCRRSLCRKNM